MWAINLYLVCLVTVLSGCEAYKILVVFPMPARSHGNLGDGVVRHLLKAEHEVTYISPFPYKSAPPNLRVIDVSSNFNAFPMDILNFEAILKKEVNVGDVNEFMPLLLNLMNRTINHENVQKLIHGQNEQFDLVIVEWMFTDVLSGFAPVFNCPFIWISSVDIHWQILRLIDQPSNPAYSVDIQSANLPPLTFRERITELYTQFEGQYYRYMNFNDMEKRLYDSELAPIILKRWGKVPSYFDVSYNASLVLANSHLSLGQALSIPQNYIPVGGYHIEEEVKPLPEDLKQLMDNAKHGVIYFSMGSNLKSKDIPKVIKENLLKVFGELKQTVLWKFEEDLPNTPKNVHILNWAPQQSILAHPKTVLFITHGGLLSTTETIHFGKPIIGIPVFGDQHLNVARAVKRGFAYKVDLSYDLAEDLKIAIKEITANPKYAQKAKELSFVYHDRPVSPGKEIAHWARHVIETRGAPLLRSPAFNMPFYQKAYLDLVAIVLVILYVIIRLTRRVCNLFCSNKNVQNKKKTN